MAKPKTPKWQWVAKILPKIGEDIERQQKLDVIKETLMANNAKGETFDQDTYQQALDMLDAAMKVLVKEVLKSLNGPVTAVTLARAYTRLRGLKFLSVDLDWDVDLIEDALEQMVVAQYEVEDTPSVRVAGIGLVGVEPNPRAVIKDKDKLNTWLKANGFESKFSVHWGIVNSEMKARMEQGLDLPDGVEPFNSPKVTFRPQDDSPIKKRPRKSKPGDDEENGSEE